MKTIEHLLNYKPIEVLSPKLKLPDLVWKFLDSLKSRPMNRSEIADYFKSDELANPSIVDELIELGLIELIELTQDEWKDARGWMTRSQSSLAHSGNGGGHSLTAKAVIAEVPVAAEAAAPTDSDQDEEEEVTFSLG